jgi:hypothetical protein
MMRQRAPQSRLTASVCLLAAVVSLTGCGGSTAGDHLGEEVQTSFHNAVAASLKPGVNVQTLTCREQEPGTYRLGTGLASFTTSDLRERDDGKALYHCGLTLEENAGLIEGSMSFLVYLTIKSGGSWTAQYEPIAPGNAPEDSSLISPCTGTVCRLGLGNHAGFGNSYAGTPHGGAVTEITEIDKYVPGESPTTTTPSPSGSTSTTEEASRESPAESGEGGSTGCQPGTGPGTADPQCQPRSGSPDYQPPNGSG